MAIALFAARAGAQPAITDIAFYQVDWYLHDGSLGEANSLWGELRFSYLPEGTASYLNLNLANSLAGAEVWSVRNLPLFAINSGLFDERHQAVDINLADLGFLVGDNWTEVYYEISVDSLPRAFGDPPSAPTSPSSVGVLARQATDPIEQTVDPGPFVTAGAPVGVQVEGAAEQLTPSRDIREVQEALKMCFPGACARSLDWLNRTWKLGLNRNAQEIHDDLIVAKAGDPTTEREDWIAAKDQYARTKTGNRIVTKVWDPGNQVEPIPGVAETSGDFVAWLKNELDSGEDVELAYTRPGISHIVTILEVYEKDGMTWVKYRDDEWQPGTAGAGRGDTHVKDKKIFFHAGAYRFGQDDNRIYMGLSESLEEYPCVIGPGGQTTWGPVHSDDRPIKDFVPSNGGMLTFYWTSGHYVAGKPPVKHPGYAACEETNETGQTLQRRFRRPDDPSITDWYQKLTFGDGSSAVYGGNIAQQSPWQFRPLDELPDVTWRIPDLAPTTGDPNDTIYTAVNLDLYLQNNPLGFSGGWSIGQTLDELGIAIVGGQVAGLDGIYWATSDFTFDPFSATGWVPVDGPSAWLDSASYQALNGDIQMPAAHESDDVEVPALRGWAVLCVALVVMLATATVVRRRSGVRIGG